MSAIEKTRGSSASPERAKMIVSAPKALPQRYFVLPEVFADEQNKIFAREWLLVGHQSQVPKPGDFFLAEVPSSQRASGITGASESLIIIADQRSVIRGFYNVCRHRGTRLAEEADRSEEHTSELQ